MTTATAKRSRKAKGPEHFGAYPITGKTGTVTIYTAEHPDGSFYGDYGVKWAKSDAKLRDRHSHLVPSQAKQFEGELFARVYGCTEAIDWLRHVQADHLSDAQFAAIEELISLVMIARHEWSPAPSGPPVHPGATSTTTPAGIARLDPDACDEPLCGSCGATSGEIGAATRAKAKPASRRKAKSDRSDGADGAGMSVVPVPLEKIHRHPANRTIDKTSCASLAESLKKRGLLQPIQVRQPGPFWELPEGHYQIVFGERRYWAAQIAGWETIPAVVVTMSDEETLEAIAVENGQRENLNDVQRGDLLHDLTGPADEGGAGMTVVEACASMGLAESTGRNLLRIRELPEYWRKQVISGEMPGSFLRPIASYASCPEVLTLLEKDHRDAVRRRDTYQDTYDLAERWGSRQGVEETVKWTVGQDTRPLTSEDMLETDTLVAPRFDADQLTASDRKKLKIVEIDGKQRCLGLDHWRTLQAAVPAGKGNGKPDAAPKAKAKTLTPAQQKAADKRRVELRDAAIERWQVHDVLRCAVERQLQVDGALWRVLTWLATGGWQNTCISQTARLDALREALERGGKRIKIDGGDVFGALSGMVQLEQAAVALDFVRALLCPGCVRDRVYPAPPDNWPREVIMDLAGTLQISVEEEWRAAQQGTERPGWWLRFFGLLQKSELEELAKQLGVNLFGKSTAAAMRQAFASQSKVLPMPKLIKPLKAGKKRRR